MASSVQVTLQFSTQILKKKKIYIYIYTYRYTYRYIYTHIDTHIDTYITYIYIYIYIYIFRVDVLPHCILTKEMCHIKIGLEKPMFHSYFQHNLEMDQFSNNIQS